jgi:hypothetical protein
MPSFFRPTALPIDTGPVDTGFATMRVTSRFGNRPDPLDTTFQQEGRPQRTVFHGGLDIGNARPTASNPISDAVTAIADGTVVYASRQPQIPWSFPSPPDKVDEWGPSFGGITVVIKHPDGTHSQYAHMSQRKVSQRDTVKAGKVIGRVGDTGSAKGQAHLHHGIRNANGAWVDPLPLLQLTGPLEDPAVIAELRAQLDQLRTRLEKVKSLASRRGARILALEARRDELKAEIVELEQQLSTDDSAVVAELRQKLAAIRAMAEKDR